MLKIKRILFVVIASILFSFVFESNVSGQQTEPIPAVVIIQRDFLRSQPSKYGRSEVIVVKGAKLKVIPSAIKGWYFAYLEEAPSVGGYIHGNSIKLTNSRNNTSKVSPKANPVIPKNIILDNTPTLEASVKKSNNNLKSSERTLAEKNYCLPSLYCPDIDEVQVILFENKEKFEKGKFEKTDDWEKRKAITLNIIKLNNDKTAGETLYFLANDFNEPEYNADKELWTFNLKFRESYNETCLPVISPSSSQEFCLIVTSKIQTKGKMSVSMPTIVAKTNNNKIQIAFVGKIVEPYIWLNDYSPIKDIRSGIYFDLKEIICLNPKTGQSWKINNPVITSNIVNKTNVIEDEVKTDDDELSIFRRMLILDPKDAEAYLGIGKIYSLQEKYNEALSSLKTALFWNFNLIEAHIELSKIYFIKGECLEAKSYSQSALQIDNQNESAIGLKKVVEKCLDKPNNLIPKSSVNEIRSEKPNKHAEPVNNKRSFDNAWKMTLSNQKETFPYTFTVFRTGKKYKGFITDNERSSSETVTIKFDGRNFKLEISGNVNFYQKITVKIEGTFDGNSIKSKMYVTTYGTTRVSDFNSVD